MAWLSKSKRSPILLGIEANICLYRDRRSFHFRRTPPLPFSTLSSLLLFERSRPQNLARGSEPLKKMWTKTYPLPWLYSTATATAAGAATAATTATRRFKEKDGGISENSWVRYYWESLGNLSVCSSLQYRETTWLRFQGDGFKGQGHRKAREHNH